MYADSYGQIVNLLNITSVDAQNQQQVKDAMVNYAMQQLGVDKVTAENYIETYDGMKTVAASMTPVLGAAAVSKLSTLAEKVVVYPSGINFKIDQPKHLATVDGFTQKNGISGGHNANAFYKAAKEYNVKVVSAVPTGVKGITEVKYLVPTKNRDGSLTGEYKTTVETKTIYDPNVFTDQKILELGQHAAAKGFNEAMSSKSCQANVTVDGVNFRIYVDKTTGTVRNFHPN